MQADFSVELGHSDPVLELPWASDDPAVRYYDLKNCPERVRQIPEAAAHPELSAFLVRLNAQDSPFETAKCDSWQSHEISAEEEIFGGDQKFVSYIDLVFVDEAVRGSFEKHEKFAGELCQLLNRAPDMAATVELIIRRCYCRQREAGSGSWIGQIQPLSQIQSLDQARPLVHSQLSDKNIYAAGHRSDKLGQQSSKDDSDGFSSGFYFTVYVSGFGDGERESHHHWAIAIALLQHALVQLSLRRFDEDKS